MNTQIIRGNASLTERVRQALWEDDILRNTDYPEIGVNVLEGIAYLSGHVSGKAYEKRAHDAARTVDGIQDVRSTLVRDDELLILAAGALSRIEREYHVKFFTGVSRGVVSLNGIVPSPEVRLLAEQCIAEISGVRAVTNNVRAAQDAAPTTAAKEESRFLQPAVGQKIYSRDGLSGTVEKVIINPNNRRVTAMVTLVDFTHNNEYSNPSSENTPEAKNLIVIPIGAVRFLTKISGFLHADAADTARFDHYDPDHFMAPDEEWGPPYPYRAQDIVFARPMNKTSVSSANKTLGKQPLPTPFPQS